MERQYNSAMSLLLFVVYACWLFPFDAVVGQTSPPPPPSSSSSSSSNKNNIGNIDWKSWNDHKSSTGNIITVELSETPTFLCTSSSIHICTQRVRDEQERVIQEFQTHIPGTTVVATAEKIVNAVFLRLPLPTTPYHENHRRSLLSSKITMDNPHNIRGVQHISSHGFYKPTTASHETNNNNIISSKRRTQNIDVDDKFCVTGKGIKVAVLDTGIDYTHRDLGGQGTRHAYKEAFGETLESPKHTQRDGLFPTDTVVEGYDFAGETLYLPFLLNGNPAESENHAQPDDDPIDRLGHGTLVASTLLKVAPRTKLVAIKTCSDICPSFALVLGIEYALDPNGDGSTDDAVDIINMSLAMEWSSALSHMETVAIERAYSLGVLTVVAAGNSGNIGYVGGGFGKSPHPLTVAATGPSTSSRYSSGFVRSYSSRYPGENNMIKPDIAAPDGLLGARATSGFRRKIGRGTSFSAPLVAGYAALLKEQCQNCSPLAIKALLMNNAFRDVRYESSSSEKAPITLVGSGEVRINKSLDADFWAYDTLDVQPSVSLGLIDAASDTVVRRTIQIHSLTDTPQVVQVDSLFRDIRDEESGAVTISINPPSVMIGNCGEATVELEFRIDASKAPNNHFGHSYNKQKSALELDKNEFDGHITLTSLETGKDIALPFYILLRKASHATISSNQKMLPWQRNTKSSTTIEIANSGAGVAQMDAFNLIAVSPDQPEANVGKPRQHDFRSIGFRSRNIDWQGCKSVFEFSINTWERHDHLNPIIIGILFDSDRDGEFDYELAFFQELQKIRTISNGDLSCNHLPYDDASNTANTIIRVCSEDIGDPDIFDAAFYILNAPNILNATDQYLSQGIHSSFSAPSHDILPGGILSLTVSGSGTGTGPSLDQRPFGLQIITNADRGSGKTGASTLETETHLLMVEGSSLFEESTPDEDHVFPVAEDTNGPECSWKSNLCEDTPLPTPRMKYPPTISPAPTAFTIPDFFTLITATPTCEIEELPREEVPQIPATPGSYGYSSGHTGKRHHSNCFIPFLTAVFIGYVCVFY